MLKLIKVKASRQYSCPGDMLYISCTYEALSDYPIGTECEMYCDFIYGHTTLPECDNGSFRIKGKFYPQPMHLRKGENITCSMLWKIPANLYAGTYHVNIGVCNMEDFPIKIDVNGRLHKRYQVGDVEISFGKFEPFMSTHKEPILWEIAKTRNCEYEKKNEIEVYVRDVENDIIISERVTSDTNSFKTRHISFSLNEKKTVEDYGIVLDDVFENDGYELLSVKIPTLLNRENAGIIASLKGGRYIDSRNTIEWGIEKKFQVLNVGILCDNGEYIMLDVPFLDDCIHYSVYTRNGRRYAALGATLTYRVRKYGKYRSIKVKNKPAFRLKYSKKLTEILYYLRKGLKKPTDIYDRGIFYYLQIQCGAGKEIYSFRDALERAKMFYNMTGGAKQTMLLRGWQWTGHDTGYPDVFTLNKAGGTMEDLTYAIEEAKKYNTIMTFHDNYDDLYEELPAYDKSIAAIDEYNEVWKGWIWISGVSHIISAPKYVKSGKMAERVKKTLEMYPVHTSYHLDVLSCEARRYDFDEKVRMAADECVEYKKMIVREFEKYGFCVTSEGATRPFAGVIGHAWSGYGDSSPVFHNDSFYPIMGMFFHGILPCSCHKNTAGILSGAECVPNIGGDPRPYYKPVYYLFTLPMGLLHDEFIDGYRCENGTAKVTYSNGTVLTYNEEKDDISIKTANGKYYTVGGNTLVKGFRDGEYLGYTKDGNFEFDVIFEGEIEDAFEIDFEGEKEKIVFSINNKKISADLKPDTAFKIILSNG